MSQCETRSAVSRRSHWRQIGLVIGLAVTALTLSTAVESPQPVEAAKSTTTFTCGWYFSNLNASAFLDMDKNDTPVCPVRGMFEKRKGFSPKYFGFETNMSRDHGKVIINPNGGCGNPLPGLNTGVSYDFEMPCKAHDYCYDLQRAGFSGTVTKSGCTSTFSDLMDSHCAYRTVFLRADCYLNSDLYSTAVNVAPAPGPSPSEVRIKVRHSGRCAHVEFSSTANLADVNQWTCSTSYAAQRWEIWPASGYPGQFYIRNANSGKCMMRGYNDGRVAQNPCNPGTYSSHRWKILSAGGANQYGFINVFNNQCMDVPGATAATVQIELYPCHYLNHQQWRPF